MSISELFVILIVALIVFGPKKLPMLAMHLGLLLRTYKKVQAQVTVFWQKQLNEAQLQENMRQAREADEHYINLKEHNTPEHSALWHSLPNDKNGNNTN